MTFPFRLDRETIITLDGRSVKFHCELQDGRVQFLDAESFLATNLSAEEFRQKFSDGSLRLPVPDLLRVAPESDVELTLDHFPEAAREAMRRRKAYLDAIDAASGFLFRRGDIQEIILKVAAERYERPPHYKTVRKWANSRGTPGRRLLVQMRTRNDRKGGYSSLTSEQRQIMNEAIDEVYLDKRQLPGDDVCATIRTKVSELNKSRPRELRIKCPSVPTIYRRLRMRRDYVTMRMRQGVKEANRVFRWVGISPEPETINEVWIADATILDNFVVLDSDRMIVLGKPTLTLIVDAHSRCIAGWYLGFEPPSHLSLTLALRHAILPKSYNELIGLNGRQRTFAEGLPFNLLMDNALENGSASMRDALGSFGINPVYAPGRDPEYKGPGERVFLSLKTLLIQKLPGATKFGRKKASDIGIDPKKDAVITLDFLNEVLLDALGDIYHRAFHSTIQMAPEDKWKKGLKQTRLQLPSSLESLNVLLGRTKIRTLSRKGINFLGLPYGSREVSLLLNELLPLSPGRSSERIKVQIKYDPGDIGSIWLIHPVSGRTIEFPCLKRRYAAGMTLHHHLQVRAHARHEHRELHSEEELCEAKVALRKKIEIAFGSSLMRERKRAARITTVQNKRYMGDVLRIYDQAASALSSVEQTTEGTSFLIDEDQEDIGEVDLPPSQDTGAQESKASATQKATQRKSPSRGRSNARSGRPNAKNKETNGDTNAAADAQSTKADAAPINFHTSRKVASAGQKWFRR